MSEQQLQIITDNKLLAMSNMDDIKVWYNDFVAFSKDILKKDLDYGVIPGVNKPTLFKPGAEKLRFVYGLGVEMVQTASNEDADRKYMDYTYKATIKAKNGQVIAECEGNANSYESKWRYSWKIANKNPSKEEADKLKAQKLGKWTKGKDGNWMWLERQENEDIMGLKNTLMKMAQKRAFVGAILLATGASEFFTQDVEDMVSLDLDEIAKEIDKGEEVKNK